MIRHAAFAIIVSGLLCLACTAYTAEADSRTTATIEKIAEGFVSAEGPLWHPDGYLLFSDVHGKIIYKIGPGGKAEVWFSKGLGTNGLALNPANGRLIACCYSEKCLLEINPQTGEHRVLASSFEGRPFNNVNDIAWDAEGNFFFTDPSWGSGPDIVQGIYRYSTGGLLSLAARMDRQPNGIAVSPDGAHLYVARSGAGEIWRFPLDSSGAPGEGELWVALEKGAEPDGIAFDQKGNLYVAQAGNGKICVISPEKQILHLLQVAPRFLTNVEVLPGIPVVVYATYGGKKGENNAAIYRVTFREVSASR